MKKRIMVLNGPNLNMVGIREKNIYGTLSYQGIISLIQAEAAKRDVEVDCRQSNHEGDLVDWVQEAYFRQYDGIVINPGAYTHYSYAIHDALASVTTMKKVEIHISDITKREEFRKVSVTAPACDKQIYGQGLDGYLQAIDYIIENS